MKTDTIIWSIIIISISMIFYIEVLEPSWISYNSVCNPEKFAEEYPNYVTVGFVELNESGIFKEVFVQDVQVSKHECIHVNQFQRKRWIGGCDRPLGQILIEAEAYALDSLPDPIFERIYGTCE